jgi:phosphoserine phosphatase RsbU/P
VFPEVALTNASFVLAPGDSLCIYTDGVTEAFDSQGEQYGLQRLMKAVSSAPTSDAALQLAHLSSHLATFTAGMPPFDDITFFILVKE